MPSMGSVSAPDPQWPSAASLVTDQPLDARRCVNLIGVSTYLTSLTPRSWHSTPAAVREALGRFSTWSYRDSLDLADVVAVVDRGDVFEPDGEGGTDRVAAVVRQSTADLHVILGGDNAATWHALSALGGDDLSEWGLITLDAHLDLRDGVSNGSPVRQLLDAGLDGSRVVQIAIADFANSPFYAARAAAAGITVWPRGVVSERGIAAVVDDALGVAGAGNRPIYVDVDLDVADRAVVPGCPAAVPGGLSADDLRTAVRQLANDGRVRAIDFTEVDVGRDSDDQRTVRLVALLVLEALAGVGRRT